MKHRVAGKKLTRDTQHRLALRRNLVRALLINGRIRTTHGEGQGNVRPYRREARHAGQEGRPH